MERHASAICEHFKSSAGRRIQSPIPCYMPNGLQKPPIILHMTLDVKTRFGDQSPLDTISLVETQWYSNGHDYPNPVSLCLPDQGIDVLRLHMQFATGASEWLPCTPCMLFSQCSRLGDQGRTVREMAMMSLVSVPPAVAVSWVRLGEVEPTVTSTPK